MKRTFTTVMPDRIGAFLKADQCLANLGLNITRVSYNKALDKHTLFIEAEGSEEQLDKAAAELTEMGYLNKNTAFGDVILVEFKLIDRPGTVMPILELIHEYNFNISYISSQEGDGEYQYFKMGLFVEDDKAVSEFFNKAAIFCPIRVLEYNKSEKILDNTIFYLSFANEISEKMGLSEEEKGLLMVDSNLIMQMLDERNSPPYKTFDYIGKFADALLRNKGNNFIPRVSRPKTQRGREMLLIEPPCGSNILIFELGDTLLFVDSGFSCYRKELHRIYEKEILDFDSRPKVMLLTHADADHSGDIDLFDKVYLSQKCKENFLREKAGKPAIREENPIHAPYVRISKILSDYHPPQTDRYEVIGNAENSDLPLTRLPDLRIGDLLFEVHEGAGGHVKGEVIYIERKERIALTGDILVNLKGFIAEQASFNRLAPYLMTSVDTDPALAKKEREAFFDLLDTGTWQIIGGHGDVMEYTKE
ncbi:MAG: MBL fold metallo-hydrolase [Firmicutes bacterium]|nr:MBL fold metallo-hydrolase [Bacillota bacterium]